MSIVAVQSALHNSVVNPHVEPTLALLASPILLTQFVRLENARTKSVVHRIQPVRPTHALLDSPDEIPRKHVLARNVPQTSVASKMILAMVMSVQLPSTCWTMLLKCAPKQIVHRMIVVARIHLVGCISAQLASTKLPLLSVVEKTVQTANVVAKIPHVLIMCVQTHTNRLPLPLVVEPHAQRVNAVRRPLQPPLRSLHIVRHMSVLRALKGTCEEILVSMLCAPMSSAVRSRCHQQQRPLTQIRLQCLLRHLRPVVHSHVHVVRSTGVLEEVALRW